MSMTFVRDTMTTVPSVRACVRPDVRAHTHTSSSEQCTFIKRNPVQGSCGNS